MTILSQCITCAHYRFGGSCDAFERIPQAIFVGAFDHRKAYPGDRGIRWVSARLRTVHWSAASRARS